MSMLCRIGLHAWRWQGYPGWSYAQCARCSEVTSGLVWWQWRVRRAPNGEKWRDHA